VPGIILALNANANDSHVDLRMHYGVESWGKRDREVISMVLTD